MKVLLDQGVARSVSAILRETGHDVAHVGECGLTTAEDDAILHFAREHGRVVVTFDSDFSALIAVSGESKPSIIHIRIEGLSAQSQGALLQKLMDAHASSLEAGAILSVHPHSVRIKTLPIQ